MRCTRGARRGLFCSPCTYVTATALRRTEAFVRCSKAGDTLSSRHASSCDVNACSWDVRGDLTLNSMAQIHTSVTLLTSRDLGWSSCRLTCQHASQNFCCRTHFMRRDVRVERSSDVTRAGLDIGEGMNVSFCEDLNSGLSSPNLCVTVVR